jgi:hypothetical protein
MFRGLISDAKAAVGSLVGKYLVRVSVAIPFVIAAGFAVAALTAYLVSRFGALNGYLMLAGGFTLVGLIAALVVTVKEQEEEDAEAKAVADDTAAVSTEAAAQAAVQVPIALLGALLTTPAGPSMLTGGAKVLGRNLSLVALLALIGLLFWPTEPSADGAAPEGEELVGGKPNGSRPPAANGLHREAA